MLPTRIGLELEPQRFGSESLPTEVRQSDLPSMSYASTPDLPKKTNTRFPSDTGV